MRSKDEDKSKRRLIICRERSSERRCDLKRKSIRDFKIFKRKRLKKKRDRKKRDSRNSNRRMTKLWKIVTLESYLTLNFSTMIQTLICWKIRLIPFQLMTSRLKTSEMSSRISLRQTKKKQSNKRKSMCAIRFSVVIALTMKWCSSDTNALFVKITISVKYASHPLTILISCFPSDLRTSSSLSDDRSRVTWDASFRSTMNSLNTSMMDQKRSLLFKWSKMLRNVTSSRHQFWKSELN